VIYIALPMASQPRILKLLDELRDTTASIYFVPDIFVSDLIQARVDTSRGMPVVAVCETPFTAPTASSSAQRPRARQPDPVLICAADARHRHRREAHLARPGDLQAAPLRARRRARSWSTSSAP
jgi:hypothetical protein